MLIIYPSNSSSLGQEQIVWLIVCVLRSVLRWSLWGICHRILRLSILLIIAKITGWVKTNINRITNDLRLYIFSNLFF